jgi:hypothetical protein
MGGRSAKGTRIYGGSGGSHSTTTAFGVSRKHKHLKFFPVKGAFTSEQEVDEYLSGDTIQCLECGVEKKVLGKHLPCHSLNVDSYKLKYGIPKGRALMTEECIKIRRQVANQINASLSHDDMLNKMEKMRLAPKKKYDYSSAPEFIKQKAVARGKANAGKTHKIALTQADCPKCGSLCHVAVNVAKTGRFLCERCREKHYYEAQKRYKTNNHKRVLEMARAAYKRRKQKTKSSKDDKAP